jgi:hypothetical protein
VAPLRLGGLRGKKSTPSVGWEVPVKSSWLASGELDGAQAWLGRLHSLPSFITQIFLTYPLRFDKKILNYVLNPPVERILLNTCVCLYDF